MHALSANPTSTARETHYPPRIRGLGAMARQVAVDLTPQAVEQVASRVAQLLHRQQQHQEQREMIGMLTVSQLAQHLSLNRAWVYEHAEELGAIRVGHGPKARIRFDLHTAKTALQRAHVHVAPGTEPVKVAPAGPPAAGPDGPILD
jgi:hypothetical protein